MPSPCLLCRHHHRRRRRHRYAPSSLTCRPAVPRAVLSSVAVVAVVVAPVIPWHRCRAVAGRRQVEEAAVLSNVEDNPRESSPTREKDASSSSASDASVVATSSTSPWPTSNRITIPATTCEKGGRRGRRRWSGNAQEGHRGRYRIERKEQAASTRANERGGGGGGERGDSRPSRCTRCRTERDAPRAKAETLASGSSPCAAECRLSRSSKVRSRRSPGPAVVPVLAPVPVPASVPVLVPASVHAFAPACAPAIVRERAVRRRPPDVGRDDPPLRSLGPTSSVVGPRTVWLRCAPFPAVTARRCCCRPTCCS